jgi:hypothetical protein
MRSQGEEREFDEGFDEIEEELEEYSDDDEEVVKGEIDMEKDEIDEVEGNPDAAILQAYTRCIGMM